MADLRRSPLDPVHRARGGRMVPFAGFELPVQYTGVKAEHRAVRTRAGLFDVSHMGELVVRGPRALDAVQYAVTNNVAKMDDGRAKYTMACQPDGGIVDDFIVYRVSAEEMFIVVNAARRAEDREHFEAVCKDFDCTLTDESERWAQIALQGPRALDILAKVTDLEPPRPFGFADAKVAGLDDVRVARTGYTGEDGVELYVAREHAVTLWEALEEAGKADELVPCGLGARDTLRLEACLCLYGNDIDTDHNPYEAGLGWTVKLKKGDFIGRDALARVKEEGPARKLVGLGMRERGIPRQGYPIRAGGGAVGVVTSGTHSPTLGKPIGLGYVLAEHAEPGTKLEIEIRAKAVAAEVVETPFYKREEA